MTRLRLYLHIAIFTVSGKHDFECLCNLRRGRACSRIKKYKEKQQMGLRFRKSISILPGVKVNLSKSGVSLSAGVPGFRNTISTSGRLTTSVGVPGSGVSYVKTKNLKKVFSGKDKKEEKKTAGNTKSKDKADTKKSSKTIKEKSVEEPVINEPANKVQEFSVRQLDLNEIRAIHKMSDEAVDWEEFNSSPLPPDPSFDLKTWEYYHKLSGNIMSGNIDTYLRLIYEVNPLDDLLDYGSGFEFGTEDPTVMEVEFNVNTDALESVKNSVKSDEFNDILQDYVCSVAIRIGRDIFALLPVEHVIVHAVIDDKTVLSVDFDVETFGALKFGFIDTSDSMMKFRHNMEYDSKKGFSSVNRLI